MNQAIRVEKAPKSKRLIAMLIDIAILIVSTVGLFLLLLYLVIGPMFNYSTKVETKTKMMNEYGLTLSQNESVDAYEAVIKKFYFEYFPNEIQETIKNYYPNEKYSSITHIYNVYVYNLPYAPEPTGDKYKGDLYEYQISKETGAVLVDELGVKRSDMGGSAYERYLKELMYSKYSKLEGFLIDYNATYKDAYTYKNNIELAARAVAIGLSVIIFATIIPLINKNAQTLGDKYMDIAYVKNKGGFKIKPYHTIFRGISLYYILPIIGVTIADKYAIISLVVFPIFVSTLLLLFRQSERDLRDLTSGTIAVLKGDSLFFKSAGEASLYEKQEENQIVEDQEYLEKLQNAAKVELETSRDEQFKNKQKEDKK